MALKQKIFGLSNRYIIINPNIVAHETLEVHDQETKNRYESPKEIYSSFSGILLMYKLFRHRK